MPFFRWFYLVFVAQRIAGDGIPCVQSSAYIQKYCTRLHKCVRGQLIMDCTLCHCSNQQLVQTTLSDEAQAWRQALFYVLLGLDQGLLHTLSGVSGESNNCYCSILRTIECLCMRHRASSTLSSKCVCVCVQRVSYYFETQTHWSVHKHRLGDSDGRQLVMAI